MLFTFIHLPSPLPVLLLDVSQEGGHTLGAGGHWGKLLSPLSCWARAAKSLHRALHSLCSQGMVELKDLLGFGTPDCV